MDRQFVILDVMSWRKANFLPILQYVIFCLISVITLGEMIILLCMCKVRMHQVNGLESKSQGTMAKTFDHYLEVTVKRQRKGNISKEIYQKYLSE